MKRGSNCCSLMIPVVLLGSLFPAGCIIVPMRMKTAVKTPSGQRQAIPAEAPVAGKTTRQQVEEQYRAFAFDSGTPNLFWAQFQQSKWGVVAGTYGAAGGGRVWGVHNLLVTFDEKDVAKTVELVPEGNLPVRFAKMQKEGTLAPLDLSRSIQLAGKLVYGSESSVKLELSSTGATVTMHRVFPVRYKKQKPPVTTTAFIPSERIASVQIGGPAEQPVEGFNVTPLDLVLKFSRKTAHGKSIEFYGEPRAALTLARWVEQTRSANQ